MTAESEGPGSSMEPDSAIWKQPARGGYPDPRIWQVPEAFDRAVPDQPAAR